MFQEIELKGIVLQAYPVGDYDKRIVFLSSEYGKISIFANGARRQGSRLSAATRSFCYEDIKARQSRTAYQLLGAELLETFEDISRDMDKLCYASYMCEFTEYYTRENIPAKDEINLLYVSFKKLIAGDMDPELLKAIFDLRLMSVEGEGLNPEAPPYKDSISETLRYTINYIQNVNPGSLYAFKIDKETEAALKKVTEKHRKSLVDRSFKSLEVLNSLNLSMN